MRFPRGHPYFPQEARIPLEPLHGLVILQLRGLYPHLMDFSLVYIHYIHRCIIISKIVQRGALRKHLTALILSLHQYPPTRCTGNLFHCRFPCCAVSGLEGIPPCERRGIGAPPLPPLKRIGGGGFWPDGTTGNAICGEEDSPPAVETTYLWGGIGKMRIFSKCDQIISSPLSDSAIVIVT